MKRVFSLLGLLAMSMFLGDALTADDSCNSLVTHQVSCCGSPISVDLCQVGGDLFCIHLYSKQTCDCNGHTYWSDGLGDPCNYSPVAVRVPRGYGSYRVHVRTCGGGYAAVVVGG